MWFGVYSLKFRFYLRKTIFSNKNEHEGLSEFFSAFYKIYFNSYLRLELGFQSNLLIQLDLTTDELQINDCKWLTFAFDLWPVLTKTTYIARALLLYWPKELIQENKIYDSWQKNHKIHFKMTGNCNNAYSVSYIITSAIKLMSQSPAKLNDHLPLVRPMVHSDSRP